MTQSLRCNRPRRSDVQEGRTAACSGHPAGRRDAGDRQERRPARRSQAGWRSDRPADQHGQGAEKAPAGGAAFSDGQRKAIEAIIKDYLLANPELMLEVNNVLEAKMDKIQSERMAVAVKENADELFRPTGVADCRQRQGRRDHDRVLRLQLRLLQEGLRRPRASDREGQAGQGGAEGIPDPVEGLRGSRARGAGRQDAGQVLGIPPRHARDPGTGQ